MTENTYTVNRIAKMAGITVRTLQHYDRIGLLSPQRRPNGYRCYTSSDANRLQLILLYRKTGMPLQEIGKCLDAPHADRLSQLRRQRERLLEERKELDSLIETVEATITESEGGPAMEDTAKFEGLKRRIVEDNETAYGTEARGKYGDEAVDASNAKVLGMSPEQYSRTEDLGRQIAEGLKRAMVSGDAGSPEAQAVCGLHRQWICCFWKDGTYTRAAHRGLADMYLEDERFRAYYEAIEPGAAQFLHDALMVYCA